MKNKLWIFARYPEPGRAKTRLIPAIGPHRAAQLQRSMLSWTVAQAHSLAHEAEVEISLADGNPADLPKIGLPPLPCRPQQGTDLGNRLAGAFNLAQQEGFERTVIIGTDAPRLNGAILRQAFDSLHRCEVVLGPAWDGGYYLIGMRRPIPELFQAIPWGTETVLDDTLRRAHEMKLSVALLTPLPDIDRPEDLPLWCQSHGPVLPTDPDTVSVIVPTWNESANIKATLAPLLGQPGVEVIVVDGQSDDETVSIARNMGASVYLARDGRGSQLNLGASIARGEYLLFLHADTILPTDFARRVREHLSRPNVAGGAFSFDVDDRTAVPSIIRYATNARSRWFSLPFGDQAMFARASSYWKGGGCPNWPILEDVALASGLARQGRLAIDPAAVITSARRWKRLGPWRTWWINQMVLLGYFLGVSPQRLAAYYRYKNHQAS